MTTWRGCKRKILETKLSYGAVWYKEGIGAGMTHWIKSRPFTLDLAAICAKIKAQQPQPIAFKRGSIVLVAA